MSDLVPVAVAVLLPNLGALSSTLLTRRAIPSWYQDLKKPWWQPPYWLFGPVWAYMYSSIGFASYLVWREGGGFTGDNRLPLTLYGTQLALNWAYTGIVFGARSLKWGMVEISVLLGAVCGTIYTFYPVSRMAAGLLVPYLGWLGLAAALNYSVWQNNKDRED
ncbi:translocator protein-like [Babylonia areolata]|uniref:translocator protein-like n=1 Tax=Babylonia areolata TaxID=304850 RepID=UPI003FCF607F